MNCKPRAHFYCELTHHSINSDDLQRCVKVLGKGGSFHMDLKLPQRGTYVCILSGVQ